MSTVKRVISSPHRLLTFERPSDKVQETPRHHEEASNHERRSHPTHLEIRDHKVGRIPLRPPPACRFARQPWARLLSSRGLARSECSHSPALGKSIRGSWVGRIAGREALRTAKKAQRTTVGSNTTRRRCRPSPVGLFSFSLGRKAPQASSVQCLWHKIGNPPVLPHFEVS